MGSVVSSLFGGTSGKKSNSFSFSSPQNVGGRSTSSAFGTSSFNYGGGNNFVNVPGVSSQRQGIYNQTNQVIGDVQKDILGLRQLENPLFQARVRPTDQRFADLRSETERAMARRSVTGTLANNEMIRVNEAGTRAVADQGALATAEAFHAIFERQGFQKALLDSLGQLNKDEAQQAIKELELLANAAGTSLGSIKQTSKTTNEEEQGSAAEGLGSLIETGTDIYDLVKGKGSLVSDIKGLFSGTKNITDAPFTSLFGNSAGVGNISAVGGGSLSAASQLGGGAASRALATGGVDAFGAFGGGTAGTTGGSLSSSLGSFSSALNPASIAGAALPAAIFAFGKFSADKARAKGLSQFAPTLQAAIAGSPATMPDGSPARQFVAQGIAGAGETFIAPTELLQSLRPGSHGAIITAYRPSTGEWGQLDWDGFHSDKELAESSLSMLNNSGDDFQGGQEKIVVDNSGVRPVYKHVPAGNSFWNGPDDEPN